MVTYSTILPCLLLRGGRETLRERGRGTVRERGIERDREIKRK